MLPVLLYLSVPGSTSIFNWIMVVLYLAMELLVRGAELQRSGNVCSSLPAQGLSVTAVLMCMVLLYLDIPSGHGPGSPPSSLAGERCWYLSDEHSSHMVAQI